MDYAAYEDAFRPENDGHHGDIEQLNQRLNALNITSHLDIGCGEGRWLVSQAQRGIEVAGIEGDAQLALKAQKQDIRVWNAEANKALVSVQQEKQHFTLVSALHLIEHLGPKDASRLVEGMVSVCKPGGHILIVTPNFADKRVCRQSFYRDPTHVRPYPADLLAFLMEAAGARPLKTWSFDSARAIPDTPRALRDLHSRHQRMEEQFEKIGKILRKTPLSPLLEKNPVLNYLRDQERLLTQLFNLDYPGRSIAVLAQKPEPT